MRYLHVFSLRVVVETLSGNPQQTVDSVNKMINTVGSTSTPSHLKVTYVTILACWFLTSTFRLYKDMGLMDVMLALLCRSGCCGDLVYPYKVIILGQSTIG